MKRGSAIGFEVRNGFIGSFLWNVVLIEV